MPWTKKINELRQALESIDKTAMIVSEPDEIAWLFNMRGEGGSTLDSLMISPLFQSLALVSLDSVALWVHMEKVDKHIIHHLHPENCSETNMCVNIRNYSDVIINLTEWAHGKDGVSIVRLKWGVTLDFI